MSEQFQPNWPLVRISDLAEINIGGTPSRAAQQFWATKPEGNPWIAISDLKNKYVHDTKEHITDLGAKCSNVKLIEPFTTVMSFKLTVGRTAITTRLMYCNEAIAIFSPRNDALSGGWLYHALPRAALSVVTDNAVKGATLNKAKMAEMVVQLPPITEQCKIAQVLDTLDTAIHETEALIDKLKAVKQGLLHDLLTRGIDASGQLRPPQNEAPQLYKESPLGWIPREWETTLLGACTSWSSGGTPSRAVASYWKGDVPLLTPKDMKSFELNDTIEHVSAAAANSGSRLMPAGTVFIVVRGMILAHSFPVVLAAGPMAFNQDVKAISAGAQLDPRFLAYWLVANTDGFLRKVTEATHGTKKLDMENLVGFPIGLPSLQEQAAITARLEAVSDKYATETEYLSQLSEMKTGLMDDLLTGRVRVTPLLESVQQPAAPTGA